MTRLPVIPGALLAACLQLVGCATPPPAPVADESVTVADAGSAVDQHCTRERRVGSNIPVTICDPHTEAERVREINEITYRMNEMRSRTRAVGEPGL